MFSPLGNTATKLAYWDEGAWVSELIVSIGSPQLAENEIQVRSAADQAAAAAENEGLLKPGKEVDTKLKKRKAETNAASKQKKVLLSPNLQIVVSTDISEDCASALAILE